MTLATTTLRFAMIATLAILCGWNSARAACTYPKAPASIPDGNTAAEADMLEAMKAFKSYNAEVDAYLVCLDTEMDEKAKTAESSTLLQLKAMQQKKRAAVTGERDAKVGDFNMQVRTFKARAK